MIPLRLSPSRSTSRFATCVVAVCVLVVSLTVAPSSASTARASDAPSSAAARVTEVAFTERSDGKGYVVRVRASDRIDAYGMPRSVGEHELKWTLYNTRLSAGYEADAPEGPIARFSTTERNGHLILHFEFDPAHPVNADAYRDRASNDLLLNLAYSGTPPTASTDAPPSVPTPSSEDASDAPTDPSTGSASSTEPPTANASTDGTERGVSKEARERWRLDTVVIDAGHGGKDPGATAYGLREKDIVLKVAKKLGAYVEEKLGINVVYTRTDDRFIALEERGHIANRAGAKLFVSLHANAARARSARGTETFFLGPHKTEAARKVMERENSVIRYEDNTQRYEEYDEQALVRQTLAQSAYMRQSEKLASLIEDQFENRVNRRSRGVHQAGFYVLWSASMPAVLVELGFLTNHREARFLNSDEGQVYLASAIFRAIRDYRAAYEKGIETMASE